MLTPAPALDFEGQTIYLGDARDVLATLPAASIHAVVTSPPYWRLRDYDDPNQIGQEATVEEYVANLVEVFEGVRRVLRPDGILWVNVDDSFADKRLALAPQRLAIALDAAGWILRCDPIWHKPSTMPESAKDRPGRDHEYLFEIVKSDRYFFDWFAVREPAVSLDPEHPSFRPNSERIASAGRRNFEGKHSSARSYGDFRLLRSTWFFTPDRYEGAHFAPMPRALVERCIQAATSDAGVCSTCGAPRVRHVETRSFKRTELPTDHPEWRPTTTIAAKYDQIYRENPGQAFSDSEHLGWNPSCACDAPSVPAVVLDPFAGAGTTALVARKLRRRSIGIELNPAYIELIGARLEEPETVARSTPDDEHVQLILG